MAQTIEQTVEDLRTTLIEYIEATYHIANPQLVAQRRALLESLGDIYQAPYLESTPRYVKTAKFRDIAGIPSAALELFEALSQPVQGRKILHDPPYKHQAESIQHVLIDGLNAVVMTGTGSGKTESFLLPILGKLAREAKESPESFRTQDGMRAMILYPMNALVNDQLGRLRHLFGDERLVNLFEKWASRPARFARYTSRTPYAGVRTKDSDGRKLQSFRDFFVRLLEPQGDPEQDEANSKLVKELKERGKWPAKPDLRAWYGAEGTRWDDKHGNFKRAIMLPRDSELVTRHEVHAFVPDLLVTNYSMLEYMLMRPIEQPVFDRTKEWLKKNPSEKFLLVLDEAHLYRGAAGAEVALLMRRLRDRLEISEDRFQVICATASFDPNADAPAFGAKLSGTSKSRFKPIQGDLDRRQEAVGSTEDVRALMSIDLPTFLAGDAKTKAAAAKSFIEYCRVKPTGDVEKDLYAALDPYLPLGLLINKTMEQALVISEVGAIIFPSASKEEADVATTNLASLASAAKLHPDEPSLLPCRVHNFFRGLRGLWACMDADCTAIPKGEEPRVCGKLFSQPREICDCKARVLELFTCRYCGMAYARGYCEDVTSPKTVWPESGARLRTDAGDTAPLSALDILLETPLRPEHAEIFYYDLITGQLSPPKQAARQRKVHLRPSNAPIATKNDDEEDDTPVQDSLGAFQPCAGCGKTFNYGRSRIQDHETKGDQPFQVLVAKQLAIQPAGLQPATKFAPMRGRKVLAFSDSRQVAARLAPNIETYSRRDSLRPLIVLGMQRLSTLTIPISLADLYCAVLLAANEQKVRLRPEARDNEHQLLQGFKIVADAYDQGAWSDDSKLVNLCYQMSRQRPPEAFFADMLAALLDPSLGLEPLAIASLRETDANTSEIQKLPNIPSVGDTPEKKVALVRAWIRYWRKKGYALPSMPLAWHDAGRNEKWRIHSHAGAFDAMRRILTNPQKSAFDKQWLPKLRDLFTQRAPGKNLFTFRGETLTLQFQGDWVRCTACKSVHRPIPGLDLCQDCGSQTAHHLAPDADPVFKARKGFHRNPILSALAKEEDAPTALIAAEHTAQLNAAESEDVFSRAEQNELLFQDVELQSLTEVREPAAIDVLSCTTTMEVGIDIGQLSGVALRNMPPGRANYQQRSGRAGRRGSAIATVVAFGGSDTHDEHYFSHPEEMIRGKVGEPTLCLDNVEIVRRHIHAFLLQSYHRARLSPDAASHNHNLFSVLGTVEEFQSKTAQLNRDDFAAWLNQNEAALVERVDGWIPRELSKEDRDRILETMIQECLDRIDEALSEFPQETVKKKPKGVEQILDEAAPETNETVRARHIEADNLLNWLLYKGVLPRYAFPTDVAKFHVFDAPASTFYRPVVKFSPSQGLPIALSQYAPGKQVWISGKCYVSGAIYSKFIKERNDNYRKKKLHLECELCGHAFTANVDEGINPGDKRKCDACGNSDCVGPARYWMRPAGFAHPVDKEEETSPDDVPESTYATRAKLEMQTPKDATQWDKLNERASVLTARTALLITNSGPDKEGYRYCRSCGRVEASTAKPGVVFTQHQKPYPDKDNPICPGGNATDHMVLGTSFESDVALFSLKFSSPVRMKPDHSVTHAALRTVCEALSSAATSLLHVEPGDVLAEYRPAVTPAGILGSEAEIFLYDTLPGGAGFSQQAAARGLELFRKAREIMHDCGQKCDASCYRCLRTFRNKIEHGVLDRHLGIAFVDYLLTGKIPSFSLERTDASTNMLVEALRREDWGKATFETGKAASNSKGQHVSVPILATSPGGTQHVIALSFPMTQGHVEDPQISQLAPQFGTHPILINELMVRKNLPAAVAEVKAAMGI